MTRRITGALRKHTEAVATLCDGVINPGCEDRWMLFEDRVNAVHAAARELVEACAQKASTMIGARRSEIAAAIRAALLEETNS